MKSLIFIVLISINSFAHPHFFIDVDLNIETNKIEHSWKFDKINSRLITFEFDKNKDGSFQK
ncbi:DUF1007 family protein, partial [Arcobacteraceae bacterium]|nr:DUF1007 family protein [Arcobacteraceae bacterium]